MSLVVVTEKVSARSRERVLVLFAPALLILLLLRAKLTFDIERDEIRGDIVGKTRGSARGNR